MPHGVYTDCITNGPAEASTVVPENFDYRNSPAFPGLSRYEKVLY
jgi:hypothetical protein